MFSIALGILGWLLFQATAAGQAFPAQLAGLLMALLGMGVGSLGPQVLVKNQHGSHHRVVGLS